jgi:hypothetical protein
MKVITMNAIFAGIEKNNDDCRRTHLQKSNKWDSTTDVLLVSKRMENLSRSSRTPRSYMKRNNSYWEAEIKEKRARKRLPLVPIDSNADSTNAIDVVAMTPSEIKQKLKEMGVKTRLRNIHKLRKLRKDVLSTST